MNPNKNQVVVNYSSKSYGSSLLFRSPNSPPPSPSPLPQTSIAYLSHLFFSSSLHHSPSSPLLPLPQHHVPPLLPLPSSAARRLQRTQTKRKGRKNNVVGTNKVMANEERSVESFISPPPPSSLPLPRFSLMRPRVASGGGSGGGDGGARSCIAEAVKGGGGADDHELALLSI
ncbi:hypothetical protein IEQ34_005475 [Dendrobium chrysotoxum]|uniref:Uncharacterized protein n=1 Tax=Dendrobium chrysotoxum TaxID=161865 RepID=A0AAV7H8Q5_DENCH|nr:hypothetical protein IEQ34_005475 [Dendrobium chrysotoxum]